MLNVMVEMFAR